ncbi:DUF4365 domain-containing protein [Paenibacillus odorifer]|uniref:DUF4365 domain-containing protein n=1 Tax=Paenibacillus odorifer TaxID=189426 RepID=UPI0020BE9CD0|nr:DUF4365 domain-containing protein [Paenibacillus odorifer]
MGGNDSKSKELKAQEGVGFFQFKCSKLGYMFREVVHHDEGVDCEIEITHSIPVESSIIAVQIKSRSEVYITKDEEISLTVSQQNINYWNDYGRPVILVVYLNEASPIYWVRVDNNKSRTIKVPISKHFDESTLTEFSRILSEYYNKLILEKEIIDVSHVLNGFGFNGTIRDVLDPLESALNEAEVLIKLKDYKASSSIYEAIAKIYKNNCYIYYNWGLLLLKLDKIDEVIEITNILYRDFPERYETYNLLGDVFSSIGAYDEAEEQFIRALTIQTDNSETWNKLGLIYYWNGKFNEAEIALKESISNNKDQFVLFNLALCYTAQKNYSEAILTYNEIIKTNDKFYDAYNNKALLLKALWKIEESKQVFREAILINSKIPYALRNLAYLLKDLGENIEAIQYYNKALEILPNNEQVHSDIALLYCRINNYDEALKHFNKAEFLKKSSESEKNIIGIIDIGYKAAFLITLEKSLTSNKIIKVSQVEDVSHLALFNGITLMDEIVDKPIDTDVIESSIVSSNLSELIKNQLIRRKKKYDKKKNRKMDQSGRWFFGFTKNNNGFAFGNFSIENIEYYNKIIKEIKRRIKFEYKTIDAKEEVKADGVAFLNYRTTVIDIQQQVKLLFEDRLFEEVYFNFDFNGYFLSGLSVGKIDKTFPFLSNNNGLKMSILFMSTDYDGSTKTFEINNICDISSKKLKIH